MKTSVIRSVVKGLGIAIITLSTLMAYGDDDIKSFIVDDVEMLCRVDVNVVDTISFSAIRDDDVASGEDFLNRLCKILATAQRKNITLSSELRLYLGCKLPREMKQTIYQVVSEQYANRFAQGNYTIPCTGHEYACKLIGRGFFQEMDRILLLHGYKVKSVFLEKVSIERNKNQAFAFTDITLTRCNDHNSCVPSTLLSTFQRILSEEKDNGAVDSCVLNFNAWVFLLDESLQSELQTVLARVHPDEMSDALKSSGNIHNPKLSFLYTALKPAILDTPSMKELSRIAHTYGYDAAIHSLGGEKLQFLRKDLNGKMFANPDKRIFGVFGFSARKSRWEDRKNLRARIVDVNAKGEVLSDKIEIIEKNQYW